MKKICILFVVFLMFSIVGTYAKTGEKYNSPLISQIALLKPYKDISYRLRAINKLNRSSLNLSQSDKSVVTKYFYGAVRGEDTFLLINCYLRDNLRDYVPSKEITTPLKHRLKYYADSLSSVISKAKLDQNMLLYSALDEKTVKTLFKGINISDVITKPVNNENLMLLQKNLSGVKYTEKGFITAVYNKNYAKQTKFLFKISAPKGLEVVSLDGINDKKTKEVIINQNTKWEVKNISIDNNKKTKKDFYVVNVKYCIIK